MFHERLWLYNSLTLCMLMTACRILRNRLRYTKPYTHTHTHTHTPSVQSRAIAVVLVTYSAELLHLHNLSLGLEEASPGDHRDNHAIDDLAYGAQLLVSQPLQQTLQTLPVEHLGGQRSDGGSKVQCLCVTWPNYQATGCTVRSMTYLSLPQLPVFAR